MRTKNLLIGTLALGLVTLAVIKLKKEAPAPEPARAPLVAAAVLDGLKSATITANGKSATIEKGADGAWGVKDRFGLPVDIENRLTPLLRGLQKAENHGLLTANPKRIEKLELNSSLTLTGAGGEFAADFGKTTDDGLGAAARLKGQANAVRTSFTGYLEADPVSWIDPQLWSMTPNEIRSIELTFPDGSVSYSRPAVGKPFAAKEAEALEEIVSAFSTLRIADAVAKNDKEVTAAFAKPIRLKLGLFDGSVLTATFAKDAPKSPSEAGRLFVRVSHSDPKHKVNALAAKAEFIAPPWLAEQVKPTLADFKKALNPPPEPTAPPAGLPAGLIPPPAAK